MLDGINAQAATYTLIVFLIFILQHTYVYYLIFLSICLLFYIFYNLKNLMFLEIVDFDIRFFISYICIKAYNQSYIIHSDNIFTDVYSWL